VGNEKFVVGPRWYFGGEQAIIAGDEDSLWGQRRWSPCMGSNAGSGVALDAATVNRTPRPPWALDRKDRLMRPKVISAAKEAVGSFSSNRHGCGGKFTAKYYGVGTHS
jgi:hypothetical protein